jgi:UDP-N-acetylglucosamine 2-epimerase (non-hydrolysing)
MVQSKLTRPTVILVLGTRPQIIKSAPLIHLASKDSSIKFSVIHTGQHYDYEMTKVFFEELQLPDPIANLNVGSGSHGVQTAKIMQRLENVLLKLKPDTVVVPGDTNSTLASALTAVKLHIRVAHIEAGARSYDMKMPEEINRRLTDHCSSILLTPTDNCKENLLREGIEKKTIRKVGDTMYDVLLQQLPKIKGNIILKLLKLEAKTYGLLTIHRPENVDNPKALESIVGAVIKLKHLTIVFPVHPRTENKLKLAGLYDRLLREKHVKLIKPVSYLENLDLIRNARIVLTDSGGMQKEAFWLKTPCITLRNNTEWIETVQLGANYLTGPHAKRIVKTAEKIMESYKRLNEEFRRLPNPFGNGRASEKILKIIRT